jgi:hypothetical protein
MLTAVDANFRAGRDKIRQKNNFVRIIKLSVYISKMASFLLGIRNVGSEPLRKK